MAAGKGLWRGAGERFFLGSGQSQVLRPSSLLSSSAFHPSLRDLLRLVSHACLAPPRLWSICPWTTTPTKPGAKGPRRKRSIGALARRAQRPAYIMQTGWAHIDKARTELDERKAKVVTLEAMVVRQSTTFRAEAVKLREVRAEVIAARATQSHAPDTVCGPLPCARLQMAATTTLSPPLGDG